MQVSVSQWQEEQAVIDDAEGYERKRLGLKKKVEKTFDAQDPTFLDVSQELSDQDVFD